MAGKAKGVPRDTAITLRLPRELHDRLREAAAGRSVSEEMRARLERSLIEASPDPKTYELLRAIKIAAEFINQNAAPWHENRWSYDVLLAAIAALTEAYMPKGERAQPQIKDDPLASFYLDHGTPETSGVMVAVHAMGVSHALASRK
jgi:hypothetical protein